MKTIKLYKVNNYQAYTAAEQNTRWMFEEPSNTTYYNAEVVEKAEFALPKGWALEENVAGRWFENGNRVGELVTMNGRPYIVDAEGEIELTRVK